MKTIWLYKYRLIVFIFLLAIILLVAVISISYGQIAPEPYYGHSELYYEQPRQVYYPISGYEEIIACLIRYESSGNQEAIGDSGKAKGILQFHQPTFQRYCVKKYNYHDNIWDPEIQIGCAKEMLRENPDNIYHWTVWDKCVIK